MLDRMKIGSKVQASTALTAGLLAVLLVVAVVGLRQLGEGARLVVDVRMPNYTSIMQVQAGVLGTQRAVSALASDALDAKERAMLAREQDAGLAEVEEAGREFEGRPKPKRSADLWQVAKGRLEDWKGKVHALRAAEDARSTAAREGADTSAADRTLRAAFDEAEASFDGLNTSLRELTGWIGELTMNEARASQASATAVTWVLTLGILLVIAASAIAGWFLKKDLTAAFDRVREKTALLARGELPERDTTVRGEDQNAVRDAFNTLRDTLEDLLAGMDRMSREHELGDIDVIVDAARFEGAYRQVAEGVNKMVASHIAVKKQAMSVVAEVGHGHFEASMPALPGKKRFINDTLDAVKANLTGLVAEINRVSAAHEAGDIDQAIESRLFQGDFAKMAEGINAMVAGHIAVKKQAMAVVNEFGKGNFQAPMPLLPGKKRFINDTIEQVRGNLSALVADADALSKAAVAGRLDVRADAAKQPGDFRRIVQGVNDTIDALVEPVRELAATLDKLAQGDLSARTDPSRRANEMRAVLEGVNRTLATLLAPSEEATRVLTRLAERDLTARMTGTYPGQHARLKDVVNATGEALHASMDQVAEAVEQVASAATQIAASSQAVASGASEQASSIQETTASLESVSELVKRSADEAHTVSQLAQGAQTAATAGTAAVSEMQGAMVKVRESAERTSAIIRDVSDIAFQTNLLALNAAVEAARAGEAGRGFAVVAEEVRSLALRAKEAATKTEELIKQSVAEAGHGEGTSKQVAAKLAEIADGIGKVSAAVGEIAAGARDQANGITQVNAAVSEMDKVTQNNAASAEESSSAASELNAQAEELAAMVGSFKLERQARAAKGRATAPARKALPAPHRSAKQHRSGHAPTAFPMAAEDDAVIEKDF
ncbi:MAG: methyl-accepting chemotaxis protein [Anaeromyxobacter sp.]